MLPIGHLSVNNHPIAPARMSNFTKDETYTLLTLWSIARSPLIMGGDLLTSPEWVISLMKNQEVINVDQYSSDNHQVLRNESQAIWTAKGSENGVTYLAVFNMEDKPQTIDFKFSLVPGLEGSFNVRDLWKHENIAAAAAHFSSLIGPHGARFLKLTKAN